eukprot:3774423-Amphidinium_carterae.1
MRHRALTSKRFNPKHCKHFMFASTSSVPWSIVETAFTRATKLCCLILGGRHRGFCGHFGARA